MTLMWALCLLTALAVLGLGPAYLILEAPKLADGGPQFMQLSPGATREILAAVHLLFIGGMLAFATLPLGRRLAARMTGVAMVLGGIEVLLSVGAVFLAEKAQYAPPHMAVSALGALLLLGGAGLNMDAVLARLKSPKAPVVFVFVAAVLVGVVGYALIGLLNTSYYARIDYTRAGRYTLPAPTARLLGGLDKHVRISTVLTGRSEADHVLRREVIDIFDEYARASGHIEVRHISLAADPRAASELVERLRQHKLTLERKAVVFECPETGRVMQVPAHEILQSVKGGAGGRIHRFMGDAVFHQALAVVTNQRPLKIYFVIGHGEKPQAVGRRPRGMSKVEYEKKRLGFGIDFFLQELRRRYYDIRALDLNKVKPDVGVPVDCDVLVIGGPWYARVAEEWGRTDMAPFVAKQVKVVKDYLERGGRVFAMIDPVGPGYVRRIAPLLGLLKDYGVTVDVDNVVYDQRLVQEVGPYGERVARSEPSLFFSVNFIQDYTTVGPEGTTTDVHPSVRTLGPLPLIAIECAEVNTTVTPGLRHTRLLCSSKKAWLRPQPEPGRPARDGNPDDQRRRSLGVAVEDRKTGDPVMVVLGTSNMFIQGIVRFNNFARNDELGLKLVAWLAGSREELAVEPRPTELAFGHAEADDIRAMRLVTVLVVPSIFVLLGIVIWIGRRR
jgi:ABC transporter family protein